MNVRTAKNGRPYARTADGVRFLSEAAARKAGWKKPAKKSPAKRSTKKSKSKKSNRKSK